MADTQTWTEHFGISEQIHQQWRIVGGSTPFLNWCLQTGSLDEKRYLQWASGNFQLPLVKDSFFEQSAVDRTWETGKFLYRWTPDLLPLEEWDGVVLIACSEPPTKFDFGRPHAFVLASPRQLQNLWQRFFPQAGLTPTPAPAPLAASVTVPVVPAAADAFDPQKMLESFNAHVDQRETVQLSDEGRSADENAEAVKLGPAGDEPLVMPEGFISDFASVEVPMPVFKGAKPAAPAQVAMDIETRVRDLDAEGPEIIVAGTMAPPVLDIPAVTSAPPALGQFHAPTLPPPPADFESCETIEDVVACAFNKMTSHFQYQMALLPAGNQLTPWLWSGKWSRETTGARPNAIEVTTPSFFRVVIRTSMPYHGYTRPSETNDLFFKEWTAGAALPHVTLVPIMIGHQTVVILMGGMTNVIEPRAALSDMEQLARTAALACQRISNKASAAAA